jgi:hypothetical protein
MFTLRIEHQVRDFGTWRQAFDVDPLNRAGSGVSSYRIYRPIGRNDYVMVELDFETQEAAVMFLARLEEEVWPVDAAATILVGIPETRIVETVASETVVW